MLSTKLFQASQVRYLLLLSRHAFTSKATSSESDSFSFAPLTSTLTFHTCGDNIYQQLRTQRERRISRFYRHTPTSGFNITVDYVDSALSASSISTQPEKTILAIHGVYGYFTHFERLFRHFHGSSVRVIAPNMPDFRHTRQHGFWHSIEEKGAFIVDFLNTLGVKTIDCVISHSSGIVVSSALWGVPSPITVKSIALFAPQTGWIEYNPRVRHMSKVFLFNSPIWYRLLERLQVHRSTYWPMSYNDINEFLTTAVIFLDPANRDQLYPRMEHLVERTSIPISILMGANDPLVFPRSNAEVHRVLGVNMEQEVVHIDPKVDPVERVMTKTAKRINSYSIANSGHFVHQKYAKYANRMVENLLNL